MTSNTVESIPSSGEKAVHKYESPITLRNLALCMPSFSMFSSLIFINVVSVPFYASIGVSPAFLLLFVALSRAFDAIVDPFVAHWYESSRPDFADDTTIRYQACIAGGVACALSIGLHLGPPSGIRSDSSLLAWFALTYLMYTISFSFVSIPIIALQWQAFPYHGSKDQQKRTSLAIFCEIFQNIGLALVFLLSGFTAANEASEIDNLSVYDSCYSSSGVGVSCMTHSDSSKRIQYSLFDPDMWKSSNETGYDDYSCRTVWGDIQTDPSVLYNPASCLASSDDASYNSSCISNYCACVGECSNLHNLALRVSSVSVAGWLLFSAFLLTTVAVAIYIYGWENIFKAPFSSRRHGVSTEGDVTGDATEAEQPPSARPLEPLVPKLVNLLRNKVVRSFLLPWLLDSIVYMTVLGTMGYYISGVIKPEYAEMPVDCNQAIAIFGHDSDSWRCQNRAITSLLLALIMFSAIVWSFVWYYLGYAVGYVRAWQLGSLVSFLSILALVFSANRNAVSKALGLGLLMGVGIGSRFLTDSIVVDVIHYYEFISGYQYQHLFAMFKILFLKISVLSMHMLPVAVYFDVGFNPAPPQYEKVPLESGQESSLAQFFTIAVPSVLCVTSFVLKMHFRLVDEEQFDLTAEGIRTLYHNEQHTSASDTGIVTPNTSHSDTGHSAAPKSTPAGAAATSSADAATTAEVAVTAAVDPTSGIMYPAANLTYHESQGALIFSHFADAQCTIDFHSCAHSQSPYIGVDLVINRHRDAAAICFFVIIALAVGLVFASDALYQKSSLLFVPLLMVIGMGWVVFAGYCAGQSLQAAILLKDPEHQPAVETLDKVIRNLDTLDDIALVKLPTREVLRRYHVQKKELSAQRSATTTAGNLAESGQHSQKGLRRENSDRKHSASKEVRALLAAEALKAAVPTKEMEVMEWEQALFRAAKRAVARSKMPTARTLKLVKTLQRSSRLNFGNKEPGLTKWEAEFYSYIAAQHHKSSRAGARGGNDGDGDRDDDDGNSASTASIDTVESDPQNGNRGGGGNGSVATETRRSSTKSARTAEPARTPLAPNLGVPQDSVSSTYFADVDYESFSVDDLIAGDKDDSSSSHFSISSEDIEQDQSQNQSQDQSQDWSQDYSRSQSQNESRRTTLSAVSPSMPPSQASIASHFDNMDFEDDGDVNYGTGDEESAEDNEDEESEEEDDLSGSEGSFGASMRSASKPISPPGESLVHGSVIRAGSALQTSSTDSRRRLDSSESVGFEGFEGIDDDDDESLGDGEVDYNMPSDDEEEDGDEEIPSPPSSADDSAGYMSALLSRATSGIPSSSLPSGVSSPAVPSSSTSTAGRPPLGSQSIDIGDPAGAASSQTLRFEEPIFSADTDCSGDRRDRGESIALSIDLHGHPEEDGEGDEDEDAISSMSEGEIAQARQQLQTTQEENDDAVSVDYSLPSDTE